MVFSSSALRERTVTRILSRCSKAARAMASAATLTLYGCLHASIRSIMSACPKA